ncbi:MAG TPA: hypothetical protein VJY15_19100 [Candidatus Acidoferrum sp.]|nr:hypothetical protein [Candidatus Acidoferrum sp.]
MHMPFLQAVVDHAEGWILPKGGANAGELAREKHVVGVKQRDDLAARLREPEIKGRGLSPIWLVETLDARTIFFDALGSVVSRAVIDYQDLNLLEGKILRENAINGLLDKAAVVIRRDQNRNQGRGSFLMIE